MDHLSLSHGFHTALHTQAGATTGCRIGRRRTIEKIAHRVSHFGGQQQR
jgi:hypothetical protein